MPERSGIELYSEDQFSKVFAAYDRGLQRIERQATATARTIGKAGRELTRGWGSGIESTLARMDRLDTEMSSARTRAQEMAAGMESGETALGGLATTLSLAGGVVAGVTTALAALGAVGVAVWGRLKEGVKEYIGLNQDVIAAQEKLDAKWQEASEHLAQAVIPLKLELMAVELKIAEILEQRTLPGFKYATALIHSSLGGIVEGIKEMGQMAQEAIHGQVPSFGEAWERIRKAGVEKFLEIGHTYQDTFEGLRQTTEETEPDLVPKPDWSGLADTVNSALSSIRRMQADHLRQMQRQEEDAARKRALAWADYEKQVSKTIKSGEKKLAKLTADYEEDRAETIADYRERIVEVEEDAYKDRAKAQEEFERRARQARERFQLSQLQSERRYQFERNQLVAEGDTLAIEQLDARHKIERKETQENESLRERQERENAAAQLRETGEAAREQLRELEQQLAEQLQEQEANYHEQIEQQRQANAERLAEMASDFAERQRIEDENMAIQQRRREEDYRLQLERLGASLSDQLQKYGTAGQSMAQLAERYYGASGALDAIMQGFHEREAQRISATALQMAALFQRVTAPMEVTPPLGGYSTGYGIGMQHGGIVTGPASFHVEAGLREAIIPLGNVGGHVSVGWTGGAIPISGLEGADPQTVNQIASSLARELTGAVRALRRS